MTELTENVIMKFVAKSYVATDEADKICISNAQGKHKCNALLFSAR